MVRKSAAWEGRGVRTPIRIGLVAIHPLFRVGVTRAIGASENLTIAAQGETAEDAFRIAQKVNLDILLLEIEVPGMGVDEIRFIAREKCNAKVIVLTASSDEAQLIHALRAGAMGYLLKDVTGADLIRAIECVHRGEPHITPALAMRALGHLTTQRDELVQLSTREQEVLTYLSQGLTNREIGSKLGLHIKTVKYHTVLLFAKLGVRNRVEAAAKLRKGASNMVHMFTVLLCFLAIGAFNLVSVDQTNDYDDYYLEDDTDRAGRKI
jgi:two-component system nitrate/nitrite response regulator NarL